MITEKRRLQKIAYSKSEKGKKWRIEYLKNNKEKIKQINKRYAQTKQARFKIGQKEAKKRNLEWNIDLNSYLKLISNNCHYCNDSTCEETGAGLDRIDNNIGYVTKNCVSCCKMCNSMKSNFTFGQFFDKIKKIYKRLEKNE